MKYNRDKLIDDLNLILKDHFDYVPICSVIDIADRIIKNGTENIFKFHITGYLACQNHYYYDSNYPVDITVYAKTEEEAFQKADTIIGYIHRRTSRCIVEEVFKL